MNDKKDMIETSNFYFDVDGITVLEERVLVEYSLSGLIRSYEDRVASYKELLKEASMDKEHFPPDSDIVIWYKAILREGKAENQSILKDLVKEKEYENQGLNPPYCYKY